MFIIISRVTTQQRRRIMSRVQFSARSQRRSSIKRMSNEDFSVERAFLQNVKNHHFVTVVRATKVFFSPLRFDTMKNISRRRFQFNFLATSFRKLALFHCFEKYTLKYLKYKFRNKRERSSGKMSCVIYLATVFFETNESLCRPQ